jgi:hypothetical protein
VKEKKEKKTITSIVLVGILWYVGAAAVLFLCICWVPNLVTYIHGGNGNGNGWCGLFGFLCGL